MILRNDNDGTGFFAQQHLREMLDDPIEGEFQVRALDREIRSAMDLIEASELFDAAIFQPEEIWSPDEDYSQFPPEEPIPSVTVRKTEPSPRRNDPCPCGSGKKYKKCCLRK